MKSVAAVTATRKAQGQSDMPGGRALALPVAVALEPVNDDPAPIPAEELAGFVPALEPRLGEGAGDPAAPLSEPVVPAEPAPADVPADVPADAPADVPADEPAEPPSDEPAAPEAGALDEPRLPEALVPEAVPAAADLNLIWLVTLSQH